jgi:hypothetical protein
MSLRGRPLSGFLNTTAAISFKLQLFSKNIEKVLHCKNFSVILIVLNISNAELFCDSTSFAFRKVRKLNIQILRRNPMKKLIIAATAILMMISTLPAFADDSGDEIIQFPDSVFKHYLVHYQWFAPSIIDVNEDGEIQQSEAEQFDEPLSLMFGQCLYWPKMTIKDFTGIEEFKSITAIKLERFDSGLPLRIFDLPKLEKIELRRNNFPELEIKNCPELKSIRYVLYQADKDSIPIENWDISECDKLESIYTSSKFINEEVLSGEELSNFPILDDITFNLSRYKTLDLAECMSLTRVKINGELKEFSIQNGNNQNLEYFNLQDCPDLYCIEVDDAEFMEQNFGDKIDEQAGFSEDCTGAVKEPESNFMVFPNPARNTLTVKSPDLLNIIRITDLNGKTIIEKNIYRTQADIDISGLANGVYLIEINNQIKKFIKE